MGLTSAIALKGSPTQLPSAGVITYITEAVPGPGFVSVCSMELPLPPEKPEGDPLAALAVQVNVVPGWSPLRAMEVVPPEQNETLPGVGVPFGGRPMVTVAVLLNPLLRSHPLASVMLTSEYVVLLPG